MERRAWKRTVGIFGCLAVTLVFAGQAQARDKTKKKAAPRAEDPGREVKDLKAETGWDETGHRSGLVAHYYRDPVKWDDHWPENISVPGVDPDDWTFTTYRYTRIEPLINHQFIRRGWFSVRWTGELDTSPAGKRKKEAEYTFRLWADDGCRLRIGNKSVIDDWRPCSEEDETSLRTGKITLQPGKHRIEVEYFQGQSLKKKDRDPIKLYWECKARKIPMQIVPASHLSHTAEDLVAEFGRKDR